MSVAASQASTEEMRADRAPIAEGGGGVVVQLMRERRVCVLCCIPPVSKKCAFRVQLKTDEVNVTARVWR